jgi:DNA adenine methylase
VDYIFSKPFLKWAGGKHKLVNVISEKLGKSKRLVEPFVGSGAVFMGTNFDSYLLCDTNKDLIDLYNNLKFEEEVFLSLKNP